MCWLLDGKSNDIQDFIQLKMALACRLLRESSKGMSVIALECGFSDQSHFSRVFKQVMGVGPMKWLRAQG